MDDKRCIKQERSPSMEGSPEPSDVKTPPPVPSGASSPPASPSEVASRRPRSPVFKQGGPSEKAPVIDLSSSSDEVDFVANTSRDFEFAQRLYGKLNRGFLGPSGDGKIIIFSDSNKEKEEVREEKSSNPEDAAASTTVNLALTAFASDVGAPAEKSSTLAASPVDAAKDTGAAPNDSSDGLALGLTMGEGSNDRDEADVP
jgi:hypothetical protein